MSLPHVHPFLRLKRAYLRRQYARSLNKDLPNYDSHVHSWGQSYQLPRGYCAQCSVCAVWIILVAPDENGVVPDPIYISQKQFDRAYTLLDLGEFEP